MTKISQLSSIGDSLAVGDQFLIRDIDDAGSPNKSVTVSGITRALDLGTAAAPAIAFATDKNSGIFSPGADQVAISTNGTGRLFVDATGNVGVGTASPDYQLHVTTNFAVGASGFNQQLSFTNDTIQSLHLGLGYRALKLNSLGGEVLIGTSTPRTGYSEIITTDGNVALVNDDAYSTSLNRQIVYYSSTASFGVQPTANIIFATEGDAASSLRFLTRNGAADYAERVRIDSLGRVGLGTSSPDALLSLVQNIAGVYSATNQNTFLVSLNNSSTAAAGNFTGIRFTGTAGDTNSAQFAIGSVSPATGTAPSFVFQQRLGTGTSNWAERMRIDPSGRVGIGTTSPASVLHIVESTSSTLKIQSSGAVSPGLEFLRGPDAGFGADSFSDWRIQNTLGNFVFEHGASSSVNEFMRISAAGTTTFTSNAATAPFITKISSSEVARIDSSGRLLVGTSTSPSAGEGQYARIVAQGFTGGATGAGYISLQRGEAATTITAEEEIGFINFGDSAGNTFGGISCRADATAGSSDYPGRLAFLVTADGAASPTEALRISNDRSITVSDGGNVVLGTTTGTKIGTATTQKIGFYNKTPVVQPIAVADATDAASAITQLNALLARMRDLGLIAT